MIRYKTIIHPVITGVGGVASMMGGRSVTDSPRGASSELDTDATNKIEKSASASGGVNGLGGCHVWPPVS